MELDEKTVNADPFTQFDDWFKNACAVHEEEANAMVLSTVDANGRPSSRAVLLKDVNAGGFSFYTNYNSRKAKEIAANPYACLLFLWPQLGQQIRVEGKLRVQEKNVSENYFMSRPRGSRLGAWASPQSQTLRNRKELEERLEEVTKKFEGKEVDKPEWWGGYVLVPDRIEFWQAQESRLHDRVSYQRQEDGSWKISRLAP